MLVFFEGSPLEKNSSLNFSLGLLHIFGAQSLVLCAPKIYKRFLKRGLGKDSSPKEFFPKRILPCGELGVIQFGVETVLLHKGLMVSLFDDMSVLHNDDIIGFLDS